MSEELARHEVVSLKDTLNIVTPDADSHTHDHVLGTLNNLAINLEEVGSLKSLEAKVLVLEVTVIDDGRV